MHSTPRIRTSSPDPIIKLIADADKALGEFSRTNDRVKAIAQPIDQPAQRMAA